MHTWNSHMHPLFIEIYWLYLSPSFFSLTHHSFCCCHCLFAFDYLICSDMGLYSQWKQIEPRNKFINFISNVDWNRRVRVTFSNGEACTLGVMICVIHIASACNIHQTAIKPMKLCDLFLTRNLKYYYICKRWRHGVQLFPLIESGWVHIPWILLLRAHFNCFKLGISSGWT